MRVALTGATGLIGRAVLRALRDRGDTVAALTRDPERARALLGGEGVELHRWSEPERQAPPAAALEGSQAIVHLLGEPIAQRWTPAARRRILDSRVLSTDRLVEAISAIGPGSRPEVLLCQSAIGYYGPRGDEALDETAAPGGDFPASVSVAWEQSALRAQPLARLIRTRTGVVLAPGGGALARMLPVFRLGLGGPVAGGRQYVSWVHIADVVGGFLRLLGDARASGAFNLTAPSPASNAEFSRALGRALRRPAVLPVPAAALRLLYGEMATVVTTGQRVLPTRLLELGFQFEFPDLDAALRDVLSARGGGGVAAA